ncbi:hypothetical protein DY000_02010028 [Brassica cretica]|uniref:TF-B3 domain-containing protein n=1 Tax=Brassica cretica TaxID=69181 RepID=A0ABQ7C9K4_BRACR|nr:hypothetical protein DY000_02010028 [Brassica cretica]
MRMPNKRFFKPLLPGFHSHLTIPVAFFLKYIEGTNEHHTAKLRSDASKITWEVKIEDGQELTDGWKEFAIAHDLRIGRNIPKKKNLEREAESSSLDPSCFLATIWPSSLRYDTLNLPRSFVRSNGLETRCGGEIVLMNEKGKSWTLALKQKLSGSTYIRRGWRRFCSANVLKTGGVYTFKLIHSGRTPGLPMKFSRENGLDTRCGEIVLMNDKGRTWKLNLKRKRSCGTMYITQGWRSFCSANGLRAGSFFTFKLIKKGGAQVLQTESDEESIQYEKQIKKHRSTWKASSSQSQNRFLTLALKPFNLEKYILYLPVRFSRSHGINEEAKMTLLDKNGVKWSTDLRSEETSDRIRLVGARSRKPLVDGKELAEFQTMWSMKKEDLALKERLSKIKLLDTLIAGQGTLPDYEEDLKKRLINELMPN